MSLDVLLPVHNEVVAAPLLIERILRDICEKVPARLIVCEDGSTDGTREALQALKRNHSFELHASESRKGYSKAVKQGFSYCDAEWVFFLDSDGQCGPEDFFGLWEARTNDRVVIGWRKPRRDPWIRLGCSYLFYLIFRICYPSIPRDPSCPFVLIPRDVLQKVIPQMGLMEQGFWWEFVARCVSLHIQWVEVPISHRRRLAGRSSIYSLWKMPEIFVRHLFTLVRIRWLGD